jgi:isocitrate/isopropylmalate dehydrogenase
MEEPSKGLYEELESGNIVHYPLDPITMEELDKIMKLAWKEAVKMKRRELVIYTNSKISRKLWNKAIKEYTQNFLKDVPDTNEE